MNNNTTTAEPDFVGFTECGMRVEVRFKDKPAAPQPLARERPAADCVAGSKYFENYTDAGAGVKKVLRSVVILRVFPGESYESENYGAIVEMTDGRVLTLVTDAYYGNIDEWDRAEAAAQLAMVEENAAELRAVLANWPDERKALAMEAKPTLMFAPGTEVTPELLSAAQALLTNEWARIPSTHRAEFHRGAEGEMLIIVGSLEPAPAEEAPLSSDAHEFAVKKGHSQAEAEAFAEFVDKHFDDAAVSAPVDAEALVHFVIEAMEDLMPEAAGLSEEQRQSLLDSVDHAFPGTLPRQWLASFGRGVTEAEVEAGGNEKAAGGSDE